MADSRTGEGNIQDESEPSCSDRTKRKNVLKKKKKSLNDVYVKRIQEPTHKAPSAKAGTT